MKVKNVAMLMRKDLRMSRGVFAAGLAIWAAPLLALMIRSIIQGPPMQYSFGYYADVGVMLSKVGSAMLLLVITMVTAHVVAGEHADRSAAFTSYLPFTNGEAVIGKAASVMALSGVFVLMGVATIAAGFATGFLPRIYLLPTWWLDYRLSEYGRWVIPGAVVLAGSTWAAGAALRKTGLATVLGIVIPILLWSVIIAYGYWREDQHSWLWWRGMEMKIHTYFVWCSVILGIVLFVVGTVVFVKRRPEG